MTENDCILCTSFGQPPCNDGGNCEPRKRLYDRKEPEHGTITMYNRKCRCEKCKIAKAEKSKAWHARTGK